MTNWKRFMIWMSTNNALFTNKVLPKLWLIIELGHKRKQHSPMSLCAQYYFRINTIMLTLRLFFFIRKIFVLIWEIFCTVPLSYNLMNRTQDGYYVTEINWLMLVVVMMMCVVQSGDHGVDVVFLVVICNIIRSSPYLRNKYLFRYLFILFHNLIF